MRRLLITRIDCALATALVLLAVAVPVQTMRAQGDSARFVQVDEATVRVTTSGNGTPAVVFEAGLCNAMRRRSSSRRSTASARGSRQGDDGSTGFLAPRP